MTLLSIVFARLYHRRVSLAERDRITKLFQDPGSDVEFGDTFFGWPIPPETTTTWSYKPRPGWDVWRWLRPAATPTLQQVELSLDVRHLPSAEHVAIARQSPSLYLDYSELDRSRHGHFNTASTQALLQACLSPNTQTLRLRGIEIADSDLVGLNHAANLREIYGEFRPFSTRSLEAILSHPNVRKLGADVDAPELAAVSLQMASGIEVMELTFYLPYDTSEPQEYRWLRDCPRLKELTFPEFQSGLNFLSQVGVHRGGIETLNFPNGTGDDKEFIQVLKQWKNLRHPWIDEAVVDDEFIERLCEYCPNLEALEIEADYGQDVSLSSAALRSLHRLKDLKCLRLDGFGLSVEHILEIAQLQQLERLSLVGSDIEGEALEPLKKLRRLKMINLSDPEGFEDIYGDWREKDRLCTQVIPVVG